MEIAAYIGIPYVWDGRSFEGADCYGLLVLWYRNELGIDLFDPKHGLKDWREAQKSGYLAAHSTLDWVEVPLEEARLHDVLLMRTGASKRADHCGLVLDRHSFLHVTEGLGGHVARIGPWRGHIVRCYRHGRLTP